MAKKQTAGRDKLGALAPKFAELNDDVLFGEVWSREEQLSARDRSMVTIAALFSAGLYPQLKSHLALGKEHGITKKEGVEYVSADSGSVWRRIGTGTYEKNSIYCDGCSVAPWHDRLRKQHGAAAVTNRKYRAGANSDREYTDRS